MKLPIVYRNSYMLIKTKILQTTNLLFKKLTYSEENNIIK